MSNKNQTLNNNSSSFQKIHSGYWVNTVMDVFVHLADEVKNLLSLTSPAQSATI